MQQLPYRELFSIFKKQHLKLTYNYLLPNYM